MNLSTCAEYGALIWREIVLVETVMTVQSKKSSDREFCVPIIKLSKCN